MNNMRKIPLVMSVIALVIIVSSIVYLQRSDTQMNQNTNANTPLAQIHSFAECVSAGFPVMESYPRQCTSGKVTFVEPVDEKPTTDEVVFDSIQANQLIQSPLEVKGKAIGSWFFEANIGLRLLDADGKEVARGHAMAVGDWMTSSMVPFTGTITFTPPASSTGYIEVEKDNPSDKRELDASARIPVKFKP